MPFPTRTHIRSVFTRTLFVAGCALAAGPVGCDEEYGDEEEAFGDGPVTKRCCTGNNQSPYVGATYSSNWSETANTSVTHPVGSNGNFKWVSASYGSWSGSTWSGSTVYGMRVSEEGQLEISLVSNLASWQAPVSGSNITRFLVEGDASNGAEQFHGYSHITAVYGPTTVNGASVYQYGATLQLTSSGNPLPTGVGNPMCTDHGDGNQKAVLLPNVHLTNPGGAGSAVMVDKTGTDYFTMACSATSVGKGRTLVGMLPNSTGSSNYYTTTRYNALIRAWGAWYGGATQTYFGAPIYVKDLYNSTPKFGGSLTEGQSNSSTTIMYLESIYTDSGASCYRSYPNLPIDDCIEYPNGVHRYVNPPTSMSGWSSLGSCNQSAGAGGVAVYIDVYADGNMCSM